MSCPLFFIKHWQGENITSFVDDHSDLQFERINKNKWRNLLSASNCYLKHTQPFCILNVLFLIIFSLKTNAASLQLWYTWNNILKFLSTYWWLHFSSILPFVRKQSKPSPQIQQSNMVSTIIKTWALQHQYREQNSMPHMCLILFKSTDLFSFFYFIGTYGNRQVLSIDTNGPFTHVFDF